MTEKDFMQNAHLPGDDFYWAGNETGVLLIHGFTAITAEVRPMAQLLHREGYTVAAPLLPGHGSPALFFRLPGFFQYRGAEPQSP